MERQSFALGGFRLKHSQAVVDGDVHTWIDTPSHLNGITVETLTHCWVQRGRLLSLCLNINSEPSLSAEQLKTLTDSLVKSDIWHRLGMIATWNPEQSNICAKTIAIVVDLTSNLELEREIEKGPHALCFRIPPADVKPPSDVHVLWMRSVSVNLRVQWTVEPPKKRRKRKRAPSEYEVSRAHDVMPSVEDSNTDDLLFENNLPFSQENIDSGYCSLLSTQRNEEEEMLMRGEDIMVDFKELEDMLLEAQQTSDMFLERYAASESCVSVVSNEDLLLDQEERDGEKAMDIMGNFEEEYVNDDLGFDEEMFAIAQTSSIFDNLEIGEEYLSPAMLDQLRQRHLFSEDGIPDVGKKFHAPPITTPIHTEKRRRPRALSESGVPRLEETPTTPDFSTILISAALRVALCGHPGRPLNPKNVTNNTMTKTLQHVAPGIWTPKHQEAVATRIALMSTIGHALFKSFRKNAKSTALKSAIDGLGAREGGALWDVVRKGLDGEKKL